MDWLSHWIPTSWIAIHWLPMDWLVYILPQRWLISVCHQADTPHAVFNELSVANSVIRISNNIIVKCEYSVKPSEAAKAPDLSQENAVNDIYERLEKSCFRAEFCRHP